MSAFVAEQRVLALSSDARLHTPVEHVYVATRSGQASV